MCHPQKNDIAMAVSKFDQFDFLIDIVPRDEIKPVKRVSNMWGGVGVCASGEGGEGVCASVEGGVCASVDGVCVRVWRGCAYVSICMKGECVCVYVQVCVYVYVCAGVCVCI